MRSNALYVIMAFLGSILLLGCNQNVTKIGGQTPTTQKPSTDTAYADGAPRITIKELQEKIKNRDVFVVDVRNQASYDAGHIPGSKLIPSGEILNHLNELPKDKLIVTYCS